MKHLRRLIWHIASRLLIVTLVLGLLITGFYYAMNMTNIYIVLKDGMARRAQVVMMTEDVEELRKYFYDSFLSRDGAVQTVLDGTSPYQAYIRILISNDNIIVFSHPFDTSPLRCTFPSGYIPVPWVSGDHHPQR